MIKETISEHKQIFILMIITLTLLLIFTVIYFVMPVNAEEETSYAIEEIQTQTLKESENKNDNNTLNIDSNNATSKKTEETPTETQENTLAEIRDTLYIISITLIIFTGAFLGYVAVSRLM